MAKSHLILGLIFDERMNWKNQIKDVKVGVATILNIIKSFAHTHRDSDQKALLKIHQMVILLLSKLRYGEEAYGSATNIILKTPDPIHHTGSH
jgi:hypothetical protein